MFDATVVRGTLAALALLLAGCGGADPAGSTGPAGHSNVRLDLSQPWAEAAPAEVGMDAARLEAAAARASGIPRFRSLLVARRGRLVLERYFAGTDAGTLFDVRSVTKSIVGALAGIAVRDGVFASPDVMIASFLEPEYPLEGRARDITVRHLLTMTSGFQWDETNGPDYDLWITSSDHVQYLLDRPFASPPGGQFTYNSAAVHVLGVVLERARGLPLPQYARERLFQELGVDAVAWEPLEHGTVNGGSGIDLRARDLLKLGQLYLQRGFSAQRSVVPESWVDESTRPRFSWRDTFGAQRSVTYGMLWWVSDADPPAFFAWGYGGQFVYVVPSRELVVVATTEWRNLTEETPVGLAEEGLGIIVEEIVPAAR
jgi:CubicO group peptidase (beta-lactamase class C family)